MELLPKSIWIFVTAIILLVFVALFPTPTMIFTGMILLSFLSILQAIIILRDGG